ncbi:hypothetical protein DFH28DRAFT_948322 [Melampsora americana]|nr:hypothetical protein DFH28DRAFT_948322 [Melampsora americana]
MKPSISIISKRYQHQLKPISIKNLSSLHSRYDDKLIHPIHSIRFPNPPYQIKPIFNQTNQISSTSTSKLHSTFSNHHTSPSISELDHQEYHQLSDETLHQLTESLETLIESGHPKVEGWDLDFSNGVLTFSMGELGTYVINKQPPSKQIWFSSPISGPKRFDYDKDLKVWFYARDESRLLDLIREEISNVLGEDDDEKIRSRFERGEMKSD